LWQKSSIDHFQLQQRGELVNCQRHSAGKINEDPGDEGQDTSVEECACRLRSDNYVRVAGKTLVGDDYGYVRPRLEVKNK